MGQELAVEEKQKNLSRVVNNFCKKTSIMKCYNCPLIGECKCTKQKIEEIKQEAKKVAQQAYDEEMEFNNGGEGVIRAQQKRDEVYADYVNVKAKNVLAEMECELEKKEVINILERFSNSGYDITGARENIVISEMVNNVLVSGRMNKVFATQGVMIKRNAPGGPIYYANPLLKYRNESSRYIVEAMEALDRMLKSDEDLKTRNDFTSHLIKALQGKKKEAYKKELLEGEVSDANKNM